MGGAEGWMTKGYPAAWCRRIRRSRWAAAMVVGFMLLSVWIDLASGDGYGVVDQSGEGVAQAQVVSRPDGLLLSYSHPVTGQTVEAPLVAWHVPEPEVGERVTVVTGPDPMVVELEGDRFTPLANLPLYLVLGSAAVVLVALPAWIRQRIARLADSSSPRRPMIGVLGEGRGPRFRSVELTLYESDAPAGDDPVCAVHLATMPAVGFGVPFHVEVAGSPRPWRYVVARSGSTLLWPLRRGRRISQRPLPDSAPIMPAAPRSASRPSGEVPRGQVRRRLLLPTAAVAGSIVLLAVVSGLTLDHLASTDRFMASAQLAVGEVVDHVDDGQRVELRIEGGPVRVVRAPVSIDATDYPMGVRYPVWVDPHGGPEARLDAVPYEVGPPIGLGALPLIGSVLWLLHRVAFGKRVRDSARRGPWHVLRAWSPDGSVVTVLDPLGIPLGSVPIQSGLRAGQPMALAGYMPEQSIVLAGELGPGSPVALWLADGTPLVPTGPLKPPTTGPPLSGQVVESEFDAVAVLPLRHSRLAWRRPHVVVSSDDLVLHLPVWFGRRAWEIPRAVVALVDHEAAALSEVESEDASEDEVVLKEPLLVLYLATTSHFAAPTTMLWFTEPQRIPPLRWTAAAAAEMGMGRRRSRSAGGLMLDGVMLRFEHPAHAAAVLRSAGIPQVEDEIAWLRQHRSTVAESSERTRLIRRERWIRRARAASAVSLVVGAGAVAFSGDPFTSATGGVAIALMVVSLVLQGIATVLTRADRSAE